MARLIIQLGRSRIILSFIVVLGLILGYLSYSGMDEPVVETDAGTVTSKEELEAAAKLLQLSAADLGKVLVERQLNVRGQKIRKGLTAEEAAGTRDALCRMIYGAMFDWIVGKLNVGFVNDRDRIYDL